MNIKFLKRLTLVAIIGFSGCYLPYSVASGKPAPRSRCVLDYGADYQKKVDSDPLIDGNKFVQIIGSELALTEGIKGYAVSLQRGMTNVATATGGYAITNCEDDTQSFTVNTRANWGSVSKLITTAAVLHSVENEGLSLDSTIQGDLPAPYRDKLHPHFRKGGSTGETTHSSLDCGGRGEPECKGITWRDLIGHRAGFRHSAKSKNKRIGTLERISNYYSDDPRVGSRQYSNSGFAIIGMILFDENEPQRALQLEQRLDGLSPGNYETEYRKVSYDYYRNYVQENVLQPSYVNNASCSMADIRDAGLPYARGYATASSHYGEIVNSVPHRGCSTGGWVMSTRQMMRFLRYLRHSDRILKNTYDQMENIDHPAYSLGFDSNSSFRGGRAFIKNGEVGNYSAYVVMLPGGYQAAAVTNTKDASGKLRRALVKAWNESHK